MTDYLQGHIKRDPATGEVAIRTNQPESVSGSLVQAWLVVALEQQRPPYYKWLASPSGPS